MVLYCLQHSASIIRSIVHKLKYHPQEEAVFCVDKEVSSPYCPKIDKITYYQEPDPWDIAYHSTDSTEEIKSYTDEKISGFFRETGLDPLQFSRVYVMFDLYNPFILYFEMHSIKYMSIEFLDGFFNMHYNMERDVFLSKRIKETYAFDCLIYDMHLHDGYGENCTGVFLCSDEYDYNAKPGKTVEVYGFYDTLLKLDEEQKRRLLDSYNIEHYDFDAVLLLNSPLFTRGFSKSCDVEYPPKLTEDDPYGAVPYFYKVVVDYYFNDIDFTIKIHPESDEKIISAFSGYKLLPKEAPIELFLLLGKKFDIICPMKSTGMRLFEQYGFNIISFGTDFMFFFKAIHVVFLAFTLINAMGLPEKIHAYMNTEQLDNFKNWVCKDFKDVKFVELRNYNVKDAKFVIADPDMDFTGLIKDVPDDCLILTNGDCHVDRRVFAKQKMAGSVIDLSGTEEEEIQQFGWSILTKNRELLEIVRDFSVSYTLDNAKVRIESSPHK